MAAAPDGIVLSADAIKQEYDTALSELYALATECRNKGKAEVTVSLERGAITEALENYAREQHVDLIVISSHGRGGISRLSLGSVTDGLIRHTTIPVLVVKPPASYLDPHVGEPFQRILVPLDGSSLAEQILPEVIGIASLEDAEIKLLYVLRPDAANEKDPVAHKEAWWAKDVAAARAYLLNVAASLRHDGVTVTAEVVVGENIAEEITVYAGRERVDLIAIATHGRGGLSRILRGSVADAVTRSARTCILVFHPSGAAAAVGGSVWPLKERPLTASSG
jgi:nucleotide-binding universal stress UspA family protein